MKLSRQILAVNALLITATVFAAVLAARLPADSAEGSRQALVLTAAILATVLVNGLVLRRRFEPLERLIDTMERVDLSQPGVRAQVPQGDSEEVIRLHQAFNRMLARLEDERQRTSSAVLHAQEDERARLARDLHDEVNQALTGVLLRLRAMSQDAPERLQPDLRETGEAASQAMDELLRLARELRPAALDDLGLEAALRSQAEMFARQTGVDAQLHIVEPDLTPDQQIVVYRVVQEALSNIAQHARATEVRIELGPDTPHAVLRIADDGQGFTRRSGAGGLGITGMRERARLAGGRLSVQSSPGRGTTVELRL